MGRRLAGEDPRRRVARAASLGYLHAISRGVRIPRCGTRGEHRGIHDEDRACGHSRSVSPREQLRSDISTQSPEGVRILRSAANIVASTTKTAPAAIREACPRARTAALGYLHAISRGGADPPIRREDCGIHDDDLAWGHSRSVSRARTAALLPQASSRSAPNTIHAADRRIRTPRRTPCARSSARSVSPRPSSFPRKTTAGSTAVRTTP